MIKTLRYLFISTFSTFFKARLSNVMTPWYGYFHGVACNEKPSYEYYVDILRLINDNLGSIYEQTRT